MARKDINVFNVSFLDLLSGALGAVLILFIIIPKLTSDIERQLKELDQVKQLKEDVAKMEVVMDKLKKSVPTELYKNLEQKMGNLQKTVEELELEIKNLQNSLAKCEDRRLQLKKKVETLEKEIEDLQNRLKNHDKIVEQLKQELQETKQRLNAEIEELKKKLAAAEKEKARLQAEMQENKDKIIRQEAEIAELKKEIEKVKQEAKQEIERTKKEAQEKIAQKDKTIQKAKETISQQAKEIAQYKQRVGFEFSDKNVVFVIDISGSMDDAPEPQKLDEVKAGIKMMIATMDPSYNVDIVIFPKSKAEKYGYKYGKLRKVTEDTKYDIYQYLSSLRAYGCTPTRETMDFVLTSPNYQNAGTIILLSDGLPTKRVTDIDCDTDDVAGVLNFIKSKNSGKVINTIGVGKEFRTKSSADPKVKFMKDLANQNRGFYIGF